MSDEVPLLSKLSQSASLGKSRDSKEVPVGKEIRRRKRGRKHEAGFGLESERREEEAQEEVAEAQHSGKVLDIII
jgi:hypothetical protein